MTNEEAIKQIDDVLSSDYHYDETLGYQLASDDFEWLEKSKKALEKQIPKKVELYKHNGDFKWENYPCPCCGEMLGLKVNKRYVKFCPNCGQVLQWEDINNEN